MIRTLQLSLLVAPPLINHSNGYENRMWFASVFIHFAVLVLVCFAVIISDCVYYIFWVRCRHLTVLSFIQEKKYLLYGISIYFSIFKIRTITVIWLWNSLYFGYEKSLWFFSLFVIFGHSINVYMGKIKVDCFLFKLIDRFFLETFLQFIRFSA